MSIPRVKIGATICFPQEAEGGPDLQLIPDIRAEFWIDEISADCRILVDLIDEDFVRAGQEYQTRIILVYPNWFGELLTPGQVFSIKRGGRVYAYGSIVTMGEIE